MITNNIDYRKLVTDIETQIKSLEVLQEDTSQRLARLRQSLIGLAPLADQQDAEKALESGAEALARMYTVMEISMTDAVRQILQAAPVALSPIQIKDQLIAIKDMSGQKNLMASVHSLIKRLYENGEIETDDNGLNYSWKWRVLTPPPKRSDVFIAGAAVHNFRPTSTLDPTKKK